MRQRRHESQALVPVVPAGGNNGGAVDGGRVVAPTAAGVIPDEVCERVGSEWTLLGIAVETLIEVFTEPDVPASRPAAGACSAPRELV